MNNTIGIYIRYSDHGITEGEQRESIARWKHVGDAPVKEYIESQLGFQRPALEDLLDDAQTGRIGTVLVSRLDRLDTFSAVEAEFLDFLRTLTDNGVRFVSVDDALDSHGPAGEFFSHLQVAIRKSREIVRGERIRLSLQRVKEEGQQLGRPRAANYEEIVELRKKGLSIQAIADKLGVSRGAVQHCLKTSSDPDLGPA